MLVPISKIDWDKITKLKTVWGGKGQFSRHSKGIIIFVDKFGLVFTWL